MSPQAMAALSKSRAPGLSPSTTVLPTPIWVAAGFLGLIGGGLVLLFTDPIVERLVWLAENYRAAPSLSANQVEEVRQGVDIWAWSGIIVGAITLFLSHPYVRSSLSSALFRVGDRIIRPLPLVPDRYGFTFILAAGGVLVCWQPAKVGHFC